MITQKTKPKGHMGRVQKLQPKASHPIEGRMAVLINARYGGNIKAAAVGMGVDRSSLWRTVKGLAIKQPPVELIVQFADHFGVREQWLVTGEGKMWADKRPRWFKDKLAHPV